MGPEPWHLVEQLRQGWACGLGVRSDESGDGYPIALDHEGFSSVSNTIEDVGEATGEVGGTDGSHGLYDNQIIE